ncbi:hypothetical protein BO86DRAFT_123483 [Aspergillus japonicus CBS 114.51]|uniref:Uncharacterized protein n=1 Tax=Aspergillus japonicus CBS 114.51 TaxID=1448312 RepID=A0A8T8WY58_ASPJA|nr:hypothetical protein BO86DRAFT_123483 [Aspergillus japonicus CBS 114.51]RAH80765.1 hypothetical protein BO86DRAFT_123483 [Aspergillus japonicus CBS 114.51]
MEHEVPQSSPLSPFSCPLNSRLVRKYPVVIVSILPTGKVTDLSLFWPLFFFPFAQFSPLFSGSLTFLSLPLPSPSPLQCLGLHPLRRALALSHSLFPPLPAELNLSRSPSFSLARFPPPFSFSSFLHSQPPPPSPLPSVHPILTSRLG